MDKINWCVGKKDGLKISTQSENLSKLYILKAEEAIKTIQEVSSKDWKISATYYSIYLSLYSILMKIGIKCEIHSCTIEFAKTFLNNYLSREEFNLIEKSLIMRINSQYYVNRTISDSNFNEVLEKVPEFFIKCKLINQTITEKEINSIIKKIKNY